MAAALRPHDATPRVFTVAPGCPFLPTVLEGIEAGALIPGLALDSPAFADTTIYLPTQRSARALRLLLAERGGTRLLPRIIPLGEAEEAEFDLAASDALDEADLLQPPIAPLERRLVLTRLVQRWSREINPELLRHGAGIPFAVPASPADAVGLAADLESVMDALTAEGLPWDEIAAAVETDFSHYFALTLDFARIAAEHWPKVLSDRKASDPARRRRELLGAEARRLGRGGASGPVLALGSTGSMPATAALLAAIASLPHGAVVLPGLDLVIDDETFSALGERGNPVSSHPQAVLQSLLARDLKLLRGAVRSLGAATPRGAARAELLAQALRPAETTDAWARLPAAGRDALAREALQGVALVEAADEREEAAVVALVLREALEEPGRTAALVTPDRELAARVAVELARWGLVVEDSAGLSLVDTPAGRLARLAAEVAASEAEPGTVLALLAHPDLRLGLDRAEIDRAAAALEIGTLRGPRPAPGFAGLKAAWAAAQQEVGRRRPLPERRLAAEDQALAGLVLDRLAAAFAAFPPAEGDVDLVALGAAHGRLVERLREGGEEPENGADRDCLDALFADLALAEDRVEGQFADYPAFFAALCRQITVARPAIGAHRRLRILGLLEARLLSVDRVILGGLDEGVWPPRVVTDAFLNRPMRASVGLPPPERRIGQSAHDFVEAMVGSPEVVVTRARKRQSSPQVPSRFLQRLRAFSGDGAWSATLARGEAWRALARRLDDVAVAPAPGRPAPKVGPELVPRRLGVTEVETLLRDPYAIFARHVLRLEPLGPLAAPPGAAERGTITHEVLARFAAAHPEALPPDGLERLRAMGREAFAELLASHPALHAAWWPRFERLAAAFLDWEQARRPGLARVFVEVPGRWTFALADGSDFTLSVRADRIERRRDGSFCIVDYKTGAAPSVREVHAGFSPQLTLEATMLQAAAFKDVPRAEETPDLLYILAGGGREPLVPRPIGPKDGRSVAALVAGHQQGFAAVMADYLRGERAFVSRPFPKYAKRFGAYDHLARVAEWSLAGAEEEPA